MTAYLINPDGSRTPIDQTLSPRERKIREWDREALEKAGQTPKREGLRYLFIPLLLLTFLGGLVIGVKVEKDRPIVDDPGFVNIEGHQGEILVVRDDMTVEWTTAAALHEKAGHG